MIDDFINNSEKYIKNHNTFLTNEEYYLIREDDEDEDEEVFKIKDLSTTLI